MEPKKSARIPLTELIKDTSKYMSNFSKDIDNYSRIGEEERIALYYKGTLLASNIQEEFFNTVSEKNLKDFFGEGTLPLMYESKMLHNNRKEAIYLPSSAYFLLEELYKNQGIEQSSEEIATGVMDKKPENNNYNSLMYRMSQDYLDDMTHLINETTGTTKGRTIRMGTINDREFKNSRYVLRNLDELVDFEIEFEKEPFEFID